MFRKGEKIVYPKHGAGRIAEVYKQSIGSKEKKYYRIKLFNSPVGLSIPVDKAEELGLRHPMSKQKLREALHKLGRKVRITKDILKKLDKITKIKLGSGKVEDVVELVNLLKSLAKQKEEENKNFSYSYSDRLEISREFIKSEVELVLGEGAVKRYEIV